MAAFNWNEQFLTGLAQVDDEHRGLVSLLNHIGALVESGAGAQPATLVGIFRELVVYAREHFATEERLMEAAQLLPESQLRHRTEHASFLEHVRGIRDSLPDSRAQLEALLTFLTSWLAHHILGADQRLAREVMLVQSGHLPKDAAKLAQRLEDPGHQALLVGYAEAVETARRKLREVSFAAA